MPQLISPTSSPRHHQQGQQNQQESDDAVTLKSPRNQIQQESRFSEESTDEEIIKSDNDTVESDERASLEYTSASSEDNQIEHIKTTPSKGRNELRVSQSLIMDKNQIERALKTFTASKSSSTLSDREPSSERPSQASRITDSAKEKVSESFIQRRINQRKSQRKFQQRQVGTQSPPMQQKCRSLV